MHFNILCNYEAMSERIYFDDHKFGLIYISIRKHRVFTFSRFRVRRSKVREVKSSGATPR